MITNKRRKVDLDRVGGRIQYRRIMAGWSRAQLGAMMGMSASTISGHERMEDGYRPRPETVRRFAEALGCRPEDLDDDHISSVEFRYTGNHEFMVVNGYEETLTRFDLDRSARYPSRDFGDIVHRLARARIRTIIHGL